MNAKEAAQHLGVQTVGLTHNDLSIAFARAVKLAHPDTAGPNEGSIVALDKAKKARDILREFIDKGGTIVSVCGGCGGKGYIDGRFGHRTCPRCNGAG